MIERAACEIYSLPIIAWNVKEFKILTGQLRWFILIIEVEKVSLPKTKIMQILEERQVSYRLLPHSQPVFTVEAAARQRGVVKEAMVKSILLRDKDGRYVMTCVTGDAQVDPKAARRFLPPDWKRLYFASAEEVLAVTGCVQGAVAPLGLPPDVPVLFDEAIARCPTVSISSGDVMAGLELDSRDLIKLSGAQLVPITKVAASPDK
jgi:prolyl-tRNA editing enzyme YbaK/EbsC (Cys-tRNA(Pro) deacylase)